MSVNRSMVEKLLVSIISVPLVASIANGVLSTLRSAFSCIIIRLKNSSVHSIPFLPMVRLGTALYSYP